MLQTFAESFLGSERRNIKKTPAPSIFNASQPSRSTFSTIPQSSPWVMLYSCSSPEGMSFEAFVDHYENKHIPLVLEIIGDDAPVRHTRHYVRSNPGGAEGSDVHAPAATTDFDCLTTVEFRDEAHFQRVFANSRRKQELEDDQAAFSDKTKFRAVAVEDPKVTVP